MNCLKNLVYKITVGLVFMFVGTGFGAYAQQTNWNWGGPLDSVQATFEVNRISLALEIFPEEQVLSGISTLSLGYLRETDRLRLQLVDAYTVTKVEADGVELGFSHGNGLLDILLEGSKPTSVTVYYGGRTPIAVRPPWIGGFTWEKDDLGYHWMGLSSQNEGGKVFMPCLDHPVSKPRDGVLLRITVPDPYMVAANGLLKETIRQGDKITYLWESRYPIMNYNVNFTMGKFHDASKTFRSTSGKEFPLAVYVLEENKDKAPLLLEVLEKSAQTHELFFGPYPFPEEKLAVVETPYLGMEHQTINAYGNNYQFVRMGDVWYDHLLHHELGHEWFGNKISIADWADYWIHEGITSYGDWLFYLHHGGESAYHEKVADTKKRIRNEKPVVGPRESLSDDAYHPDVYTKGAYIMHSLRFMFGDDRFFPLLKRIAEHDEFTYANQVSTEELISFLEAESGESVKGFLEYYLYGTKLPKVKVNRKKKGVYEILLQGIGFALPMEVATDRGIEVLVLSGTPTQVVNDTPPVVDPRNWYLLHK